MKKTGEILKSAREQAKLTLKEISSTTKINIRMLKAIEEGRTEDLPPATFLRGFIKTYSTYLKLDPNEIMNIYKEELNPTPIHVEAETATKATTEAPVLPTSQAEIKATKFDGSLLKDRRFVMKTLTGVAIVSLLCFVLLVKNIIQKYERENQITSPPKEINTINADKSSGEVVNSDVLSEQKVVEEKPRPKKVEEKVTPSAIAIVQEKEPPPQSNKGPEGELKKVVEAQKAKISPLKEKKPEPKKIVFKQEIILETLDKVSVKMVLDNNTVRRITLNPSQVHIIKANQTIELEISDGGAINLIHNGRDIGVPGDLGSVFKKTYQ